MLDQKIKQSWWGYLLAPFVVSLILYSGTFGHQYALDDQLVLTENVYVKQGWQGIDDLMTRDAFEGFFGERGSRLISGGRYRPLSLVTFALEYELWGLTPEYSHIVNVVLYGCMCSVLLLVCYYWAVNWWGYDPAQARWLGLIVSLLYAVHPIHTEVVANIKGRDEIMCFWFGALAILYFERNKSNASLKQLVIFGVLWIMSMLSKETGVGLILFWLLSLWWIGRGVGVYKRWWMSGILALIVYLVMRYQFTHSGLDQEYHEVLNFPYVMATSGQKWATILYSQWQYIRLMIFPVGLTHDYYYNQIPYQSWSSVGTWLGILIIGISVYAFWRWRHTQVGMGVMYYWMTLAMMTNVLFNVGVIMNERFVFMASFGFLIAVVGVVQMLIKTKRHAITTAAIVFVVYWSIVTYSRNPVWYSNQTLFEADVVNSPNSAKVNTSAGGVLLERAEKATGSHQIELHTRAKNYLYRALQIYSENGQTWLLLGNAYLTINPNKDSASYCYHQAIKYRGQNYIEAITNLAILHHNYRQYDSAMTYAERGLSLAPNSEELKKIKWTAMAKLGLTNQILLNSEAVKDLAALEILAEESKTQGNYSRSKQLGLEILSLDNQNPIGLYIVGISLARGENKIAEAIPYLERAVSAKPQNINWKEDLAVAYGMTGRISATIPLLEQVIAAHPLDPNPIRNLASSYYKLGNKSKAEALMRQAETIK